MVIFEALVKFEKIASVVFGARVGKIEGDVDGATVSFMVGNWVGFTDGWTVGESEVGDILGPTDGKSVGYGVVGDVVGKGIVG